jgi:hypothetical protein
MFEAKSEPVKPIEVIAVQAVEKALDNARSEAWNMQRLPSFHNVTKGYLESNENGERGINYVRRSRLAEAKKQLEALRRNLDAIENAYNDVATLIESGAIEIVSAYGTACYEWDEAEAWRAKTDENATFETAVEYLKKSRHYASLTSKQSRRNQWEAENNASRCLNIIAAREYMNAEQFQELRARAYESAGIEKAVA